MRPVTVTQTGTGRSAVVVTDYIQTPFNAGVATKLTGAATYDVQHTFDDVFSLTFSSATANWYTSGAPFSGATTSGNATYNQPIRGLSVNVLSGTGSVDLTVLQGLGH